MKTAYLDCFSGISGDMLLGALLDAGMPFEALKDALDSLPLTGYDLEVTREERNSLSGTRFQVKVEEDRHVHRNLEDIKAILSEGNLGSGVLRKSIQVFEMLAREEGRVHNRPVREVHFHEVGAVDSIIDIAGSLFGMEFMGIDVLTVSPLPLGSGFADTRHGAIPIPAPATLALLKGVPVHDSGLSYELVTPTGAALAKALADSFGPMPAMVLERVGYGVGTRNLPDRPNLLRIVIGEDRIDQEGDTVLLMEANIDDANPEWIGFLMDRLFEAGALDVLFCPVFMKKNRPGTLIQVMGKPHHRDRLMDILFQENITLGVRYRHSLRRILPRTAVEVDTPWGPMKVKKVTRPDGSTVCMPEYDACQRIARDRHIPLRDIYAWVATLNRR